MDSLHSPDTPGTIAHQEGLLQAIISELGLQLQAEPPQSSVQTFGTASSGPRDLFRNSSVAIVECSHKTALKHTV